MFSYIAYTVMSIAMKRPVISAAKKAFPIKPIEVKKPKRGIYGNNTMVKGIDFLEDKNLNKSLAFTPEERQVLGIRGLLAPQYRTLQYQIQVCQISLSRLPDNLNRYIYLTELEEINEKLFFNVLNSNLEKYLPILYTPTVGLACHTMGLVYRRPRGLFVTMHDRGHISDVLRNWPYQNIKLVVFTDGERTCGFGDCGANGMALPVAKSSLYTALGRLYPEEILPIVLDCGTDNVSLLEDPLYIGLREPRLKGEDYMDFMDEFMYSCNDVYGGTCLLQFEDFSIHNGPRLLERYKDTHCTFNDDIQVTAAVVVSGLLSAMKITRKKLCQNVYQFLGAGSAAIGIANLLVDAMMQEGVSRRSAQDLIYMHDKDGLLTTKRNAPIPDHARDFVKNSPPENTFTPNSVAQNEATVLIGCSTARGLFTPEILHQMAKNCERPVIFALSSPAERAECTAQEAYENTEGRCIFASGCSFPAVRYDGKDFYPGQANNAFIFPGVALGVTSVSSFRVTNDMFLAAARKLSSMVTQNDLCEGRVFPPLSELSNASLSIATEVAKLAYDLNLAIKDPEPENMTKFIKDSLYDFDYHNYTPSKLIYNQAAELDERGQENNY